MAAGKSRIRWEGMDGRGTRLVQTYAKIKDAIMSKETPRTDAVARWNHTLGLYRTIITGTVDVEFARQLEREIDELKIKIEQFEHGNKTTNSNL